MPQKPVYLSKIRIRAYRSCRSVALTLEPDITTLIGPNGSGKTNILQAITLLRARSTSLNRAPKKETSPVRCQIEAEFVVRRRPILFRANIFLRQNEQNEDELLFEYNKWNFKAISGKNEWTVATDLYERDLLAKLGHIKTIRSKSAPKIARKTERMAHRLITEFCSSIGYYGASQFTKPGLCPTSFEVNKDGSLLETNVQSDHVKFMYDLFLMKDRNPTLYENYISLLDSRGLNLVDKISWRTAKFSSSIFEVKAGGKVQSRKTGKVLIIPTIHIRKSQLSFNQLSEGTFRTLALIFYIVTDRSHVLLVEEPEVCIHHGLLNSIIEVIKSFSRDKQIIFSTHSEAVVDQLKPSNLRLVKNLRTRGTTITPISHALSSKGYEALKRYLEKSGNLGEYWRHSGFER